MKRVEMLGALAVLALTVPAGAGAQGGVFRLPSNGGARQATSRPAEPVPTPPTAQPHSRRMVPGSRVSPRYPVAYTVVPAIVMSDGSIYANVGSGYVPVRTACAERAPRVLGSNGQLRSNAAPTYTQPVPSQATASQQMARAHAGQPPARYPAPYLDACYRMDAYGPVVIVR